MKTANNKLIQSPISMSWTSDAIHVGWVVNYSIQLTYTTNSAVVKLQFSNDDGLPNQNNTTLTNSDLLTWTDVDASIVNLTEDGDLMYDVDNASYKWVRVLVIGSGTVTSARFNTKG